MKRAVARARRDLISRIFRFDRRRHVQRAAVRLERRVLASGQWGSESHGHIQQLINVAVRARHGR